MKSGSMGKLLKSSEEVQSYLREQEWISSSQPVRVEALSGGVSSRVWKIGIGSEYWVLKQALPKLNVQADWYSDTSRIVREQRAMQTLYGLLPHGTIPELLHTDPDNFAYVMTCAPEDAVTWKSILMKGRFETELAGLLGRLLGLMHRGSMELAEMERDRFRDLRYFEQLRIDPFHRHLIRRYPELAQPIERLIHDLTDDPKCLVHGDFSPKNILVTPQSHVILIDFEVAHWGNPVFDLAFCIGHLLLKGWALTREAETSRLIEVFFKGYGPCPPELLAHLGLMLLARMDGKSPIEYISDEPLRAKIRHLAILWIGAGTEADPMEAIEAAMKGSGSDE